MNHTFIKTYKVDNSSSSGWVLIETLMSLAVFALVIGLLNQQNEHDFEQLTELRLSTKKTYREQQILTLRRLKQDYTWLEASLDTGGFSECETCTDTSLDAWFLYWIAPIGVIEFLPSEEILGVSE
ncbi:hypothetical protein OA92_13850 [Marinomonas sp. SBI22]|uniref:hypothetical protein n=1 Tax=unclassified Marinomonas TaxID=196814 RepID=UPI0007AF24CA|nr:MULTISPECIES: hypothetical protein [unclassified Marinomonas]KZM41484.1 hypothetical protein OA92_13850 [Marinomonas sp. SBI22]KZM43320.1 hypothetical protein OA91_12055 [Marinomonas sp. SBI8L]